VYEIGKQKNFKKNEGLVRKSVDEGYEVGEVGVVGVGREEAWVMCGGLWGVYGCHRVARYG